ncbi:MAG: hypothetical protein LBJ61_10310 [Deltaproteobacteria bacterium]|nr:hypothetical protein [Deltaproteobacteria bacterium]
MVILAEGPILTKNDLPDRLLLEVGAKAPSPKFSPAPLPSAAAPEPETLGGQAYEGTQPDSRPAPQSDPLSGSQPGSQPFPQQGLPHLDDPSGLFASPGGPDFSKLASTLNSNHPKTQSPRSSPETETGELIQVDLDPELAGLVDPILDFPESGVDLSSIINRFEDRLIKAALAANKGVKNHAAKALGLNRTTFLEKLKKKGFD